MVRVGGPVSSTTASLRIGGDDLDPDEITALLRCSPTISHRKGDFKVGSSTGKKYIKKSGLWSLAAIETGREDLDQKIVDLLDQVTDDIQVWRAINSRFSADVFCGLFMDRSNEGLGISASTMARLGERSIKLALDIYGPEFDDDLEGHLEAAKLERNKPPN
jgi:Domain of unknown function (DUF4279)